MDTVSGIEEFRGTTGADTFIGDAADNYFLGMDGNDTMSGGAGNDILNGGAGNITMDGGSGNDRLIDAGGGTFLMTGGSGADTFDFHLGGHDFISHDELTDFNFSEGDRIDFSGSAYVHQMSDIHVGHDAQGNAMLTFATPSGTGTIVLDHVHMADVNSSMFFF